MNSRVWMWLTLFLLCASSLRAQDSDPASVPTLHVYTNLIQIPVLVLRNDFTSFPLLAPSRFSISIDNAPVSKPTHVRLESEYPIQLALVFDTIAPVDDILRATATAAAHLPGASLTPRDHLSVYTLGCTTISRFAYNLPADPEALTRVMGHVTDVQSRKRPNCKGAKPLWDALAVVASNLYQLPGRRVILVVTNGFNSGSTRTSEALEEYAQGAGVAIFAFAPFDPAPVFGSARNPDNLALDRLCQLTGGILQSTLPGDIHARLPRFIQMLRGRYIVEFPRSRDATPGRHNLHVSIANLTGIILAAGDSVPIASQQEKEVPVLAPLDPETPAPPRSSAPPPI